MAAAKCPTDRELETQNQENDAQVKVLVFCVVRPCEAGNKDLITFSRDKPNSIFLFNPEIKKRQEFSFRRVFDKFSTIETVFNPASPCIRHCLDGVNVFMFFHGGPGSGKSYLIRERDGFINLTTKQLSTDIRNESSPDHWTFSVKVSNWDINNNDIIDVLTEGRDRLPHSVIKDLDGQGCHVSNLIRVEIEDEKDLQEIFDLAEKKRELYLSSLLGRFPPPSVGPTAEDRRKWYIAELLDYDFRMSSVFQFHVKGFNATTKKAIRGSIFIVELAEKTKALVPHVLEWQNYMKKSLLDVTHITSARSHLIKFIHQNSGRDSKTLVYTTVSPEENNFYSSIYNLTFVVSLSTQCALRI